MQQIIGGSRGSYRFLELPDPDASFLPGVLWGSFEHALTPAFWVSQAWQQDEGGEIDFTLTQSLREEVVTCLLGGHGAPAEVGLAASARVLEALAQESTGHLSQECLEAMLLEPLTVRGRQVRYRFARQRAKFLAGSLTGLDEIDESDLDDVAFRDALCGLPGIGPKTASWIVRNRRASDEVAILDVTGYTLKVQQTVIQVNLGDAFNAHSGDANNQNEMACETNTGEGSSHSLAS